MRRPWDALGASWAPLGRLLGLTSPSQKNIKCPNGLQDGLRSFDLAYLNSQKAKTLIFDDPTTLFEGPDRSRRATGGQVGDHFGCMEAKFVCIKIHITVQMASKMRTDALQVTLQVLQVRLGLHLVLQTGFHGLQDGLRSSNSASIQPKWPPTCPPVALPRALRTFKKCGRVIKNQGFGLLGS